MPSPETETKLIIRPFEPPDLPRLQEIREAAFRAVFDSFRAILGAEIAPVALANAETEQAALLSSICAEGSKARVYVAIHDRVIAGFASYTLDEATHLGEIGLNAVHPDYANKGFGTRLFEFILDRMREQGAQVAAVSTGGDPSHGPARRAYAKAGFTHVIPSLTLYRKL